MNLPPANRFSAGVNFTRDRYLGDLVVNYTDSAFWQDVLNEPFHTARRRPTPWSTAASAWWMKNWVDLGEGNEPGQQKIQQHVFGDIIQRSIIGG